MLPDEENIIQLMETLEIRWFSARKVQVRERLLTHAIQAANPFLCGGLDPVPTLWAALGLQADFPHRHNLAASSGARLPGTLVHSQEVRALPRPVETWVPALL